MSEQDLSLLTDKERALWQQCKEAERTGSAGTHIMDMLGILRALIAARAENKRIGEMLAKAEEALIWASGAFQSEEESAAWAAHGRPIVDEMRALLQSEKGVDMPKVTTEHCPNCCSLTHFEDVELPRYRVLGVPEPPEYKRIEVCPECGCQSEKGGAE